MLAHQAPLKVERKNSNMKLANEKRLQSRKKLNIKRHFTRNCSTFEERFPARDTRKVSTAELKLKAEKSNVQSVFSFIFVSLY